MQSINVVIAHYIYDSAGRRAGVENLLDCEYYVISKHKWRTTVGIAERLVDPLKAKGICLVSVEVHVPVSV